MNYPVNPYESLEVLLSELERLKLQSLKSEELVLKAHEAIEVWYQKHSITAKSDVERRTIQK